ncbi:uncharacterized protein [Procambarus clarkii]|uniref:uncharacterized protein isoform X3 n=1 Tax=Procambarus clarkii TaxID=6728 RepID=UPI001E6755F2|nr:zinc finger protein with KRAB and SCAN domains 8-like isoform X3 [Procambarus clarkii]
MSSGERRPLKRKAEESLEQEHGRSKTGKEARTEVLVAGCTTAGNIGILTLSDNDWACLDSPPIHTKENTASISKREENKDGSVSCGVMWRGDEGRQLDSSVPQVCLSCKREANGKTSDCGTQTFHFLPATSAPEAFVLESGCKTETSKQVALASVNLKNIKVEVPDDQEYERHPLVCCVRDCESRSNEADSIIFYAVPHNKELKLFWAEVLDIIVPDCYSSSEQYVCSLHFITPQKLPVVKTKTRKKKTCDMLVAEEAEKIKQGLSAGRPKRTPKPNKNYDWAELTPFIKTELSDPDEMEFVPVSKAQVKSSALVGRRRKQALTPVKKEDKENEMPSPDTGTSVFENEDEYGENVSLPSHPRAPPPKPKGRPHRIRDTCTQTDALHSSLKQPLREVKVQCNLSTEPLISCPNCSIIDWMKLEELLIDYLAKIEGELCDPVLSEYFRNLVSDVQEPTHATNVLKLLSGLERDSLEGTKDIILISSQDDEVEIENVIHPEVEAPMTGLREITPKLWQENTKWKKEIEPDEDVVEDDTDGLGLQEATEIDDDEFHPGFPEPDEDEEEDQELDDEDWNINKRDSDSGISSSKRKQKKVNQRSKKEQTLAAGEAGAGIGSSSKADVEGSVDPETPTKRKTLGRRRRPEGDTRWIRREHPCHECDMVFSTQRKFDLHFSHIHLGVAPWQGEHTCADCGKTFTQKISLKVHRMFKHGAPRRYQCTKCTYEGPTKEYLKRHMKVHTDERQFICPECGKGLKTAESYRNHLVIHTNEGRFFCEVCSKAYNHKGAYEDHQRSHQDDRDYACNYCGAAFKAYKHVARHIRAVHLNDKRFICDVCGAQHMTGFNLKGHIKKHGDISDLPYVHQCTTCDAKFRGSEGLKTHMRMEHKIVSSSGEQNKMPEEKIITPHPTRRPVRFQYSRISNSMLGEGSSKTYHPQSDLETIYIDGDTFVVCDEKASDVVYEVYSTSSEEHNTDPLVSSDEAGGQRIINVFPCSICHTMFTSETLLYQHQSQVHPSHIRKPASSK